MQSHYTEVPQASVSSAVEQYTIDYEYLAYFCRSFYYKFKNKYGRYLGNFLVWTLQYFKEILNHFFAPENMKKTPLKFAQNRPPICFQYCQPAQKPAQILFSVP